MTARCKELFLRTLEMPEPERLPFLSRACGDDLALQQQLIDLLRANEAAGAFLEQPAALGAVDLVVADAAAADDGLWPGDRIDDYELLQRIGHGGFGSVWRARQLAPFEREVALKICHEVASSEAAAQRFLIEQQALARMQHPGVAKVLDAGTAPDGRPWLTMELLDGQPITTHCTRQALPLAAKLELFLEVCAAVQHAHTKGIVHLDLKPANVLVLRSEGRARPVVIDFGVARVHEGDGTAAAPAPLRLGTPDYMSPERIDGDPFAIDARADVYALGVLLYELSCGQRPFRRATEHEPLAMLRQRIRNGPPPLPGRRSVPKLPAELDWVTARAMAADPNHRYPTALSLADDVRRLLADEPVAAAPPGRFYRLRCLVRRHRGAILALGAVLVLLSTAVVLATAGWVRASAAEQRAIAQQLQAEQAAREAERAMTVLDGIWTAAGRSRVGDASYSMRQWLVDSAGLLPRLAAGEPAVELRVCRMFTRAAVFLGERTAARTTAGRAVELARGFDDRRQLAAVLLQRAEARGPTHDTEGAEADAGEALSLLLPTDVLDSKQVAAAEDILGWCAMHRGDFTVAFARAESALQRREQIGEVIALASSLYQLAALHAAVGRPEAALPLCRRAIEIMVIMGPDDPALMNGRRLETRLLQGRGDLPTAEAAFRADLAHRRRLFGDADPSIVLTEGDLAWCLAQQGCLEDAETMLRSTVASMYEVLPYEHVNITETLRRLGAVLLERRRFDAAEPVTLEALARIEAAPSTPLPQRADVQLLLARLRLQQGDHAAARSIAEAVLEQVHSLLPPEHMLQSETMELLALIAVHQERPDTAIEMLQQSMRCSEMAGRTVEARRSAERLLRVRKRFARATKTSRELAPPSGQR